MLELLEGASFAVCYSTGMAATTALFQLFNQGDHILVSRNTYGGTYRMAMNVLSRHGISFDWIDTRDPENIKEKIKTNTKLVHVESPTNPLLELCDIKATAEICKDKNILLSVDNTFMSPYGQSPIGLGADVVMHSATKFIGGHSDLIAGVLITNDSALATNLYFIQKSGGAVLSPFDSWMLLRSTKTLALRFQQHSDNAMALAEALQGFSKVNSVVYPGLPSHNQYDLATKQQKNPMGESIYGSMISFECQTKKMRDVFLKKIELFTLAESLGGVESLVCVPYEMTHVSVPTEIKESMGLSPNLIRLSVGVEYLEDLVNDLAQALGE